MTCTLHELFPGHGPDPALQPLRDYVERLLPVRYPRPDTKPCPACAEWRRALGTDKIGRYGCPLCDGDGRVPIARLNAYNMGGQTLVRQPSGHMAPQFSICQNPGQHRLVRVGGQVRCPGCDALCTAPANMEAGTLITTTGEADRESGRSQSAIG